MSFPFLVNKRPTLLICATRDMLKKITDHQRYLKNTAMTTAYNQLEDKPTSDSSTNLYTMVEPGQTWKDLDETIDEFTPAAVYLYLESSLDKMPLYKKALIEKISNKFGPHVKMHLHDEDVRPTPDITVSKIV